MILEPLVEDDIAICVNYICDEYEVLGGDPKKVAMKMTYAIEGKEGWKVVDGDMIVGFTVIDPLDNCILVTSLVVGRGYRIGKVTWLLFKKILERAGNGSLIYIPLHRNMWASNLCVNGVIDKTRAKEWVDKMESKYGRE